MNAWIQRKGYTCAVDDFRGLYRKGSVAPVNIGFMPLRRAVNTDIVFSIGNRTKGSLKKKSGNWNHHEQTKTYGETATLMMGRPAQYSICLVSPRLWAVVSARTEVV